MTDDEEKQKGLSKVWAIPAAIIAAMLLAFKRSQPVTGRAAVVAAAVGELGKRDARPYVDDALGYHSDASWSWCGMFALWALHRAGLAKSWKWEIGVGFLYRLPRVALPQPGDIAYFHEPYQHHAVVESFDPIALTVTVINGNGTGGVVTRSTVPLSSVTGFYSIDPLLEAKG